MKKTVLPTLAVTLATAMLAQGAYAQDAWPSKPITVVVPYTPGGSTDTVSRVVMQKLSERLGQTIVIENKPGANSTIGTAQVARAKPDGYTFVTVLAAYSANPHLYKLSYDNNSFEPVSHMADLPLFLFTSKKLPVNSIQELVEYGKKNPLNYASSGIGSSAHLTGAHFAKVAGLEMNHIPYKGSAPILADLLSGQVSMAFDPILVPMPYVKEGKLNVLGVTSLEKYEGEESVPTLDESGFKGFKMNSWVALMAPAGTPSDITERVSKEIAEVVKDPEVIEKFKAAGFVPIGSSPADLAELIKKDSELYGNIVREGNIKVQ